jgi:hypothetical protein
MHATNTFPVDRHPQYRHYPMTIRSIASGIIIEVEKIHIKRLYETTTYCVCLVLWVILDEQFLYPYLAISHA